MKLKARILMLFSGLLMLQAFACRYSVRDTGFVDLGEELFQLVLAGRVSANTSDLYRRLASATLQDANIEFVRREDRDAAAEGLFLQNAEGRKLGLAGLDGLPATPEAVTALLETVAVSPLRSEIHEKSLQAFAVVILVEGKRSEANVRAASLIDEAIRKIAAAMPSMPKPVSVPPAMIRVTLHQQKAERIALWGLGFEPEPNEEPRAAIVFGRGRRLGTPMEGPLLTRTALQERLMIIGQDCECDLDRAWMKGPLLPSRWDAPRQKQAAQALGFDPENPLVRTEISRIVNRGPGSGGVKKLARARTTLGYSESAVEDLQTVDEEAASRTSTETPARASVVGDAAETAPKPVEKMKKPAEGFPFSWILGAGIGVVGVVTWWWIRVGRERG